MPLALAGPWLAAVDFDVRRLPDRVLLPLLAWQALITAGLFITGHRDTGLAVVIGAVACLIGLSSLHWFSDGAVGFGDVKLGVARLAADGRTFPGATTPVLATRMERVLH